MRKFIVFFSLIIFCSCIKKQSIKTIEIKQMPLNQSSTIQDLQLKSVIFTDDCNIQSKNKIIYCIDEINLLNLINNIKISRIGYNEVKQKLIINDKYYDNSK